MGRLVARVPNEDPERLRRIMDVKYRKMGVDTEALQQQAQDRHEREAAEKQRNRDHDDLADYYSTVVTLKQQEADEAQRAINCAVRDFQATSQGHATTREWDLERPDRLHADLDRPARIGDDDPRCGPASLQLFDGEDLAKAARVKEQKAAAREAWDVQSAEKAAQRQQQKEQAAQLADLIRTQDHIQKAAESEEWRIRAGVNRSTAERNADLAAQRLARDRANADDEAAADEAELQATVMNAALAEDPNLAASSLSEFRVRKDHWKGMSGEQRWAVTQGQLQQMADKKARAYEAAAAEMEFARRQARVVRAITDRALKVEEFKRLEAQRAADFLKKQMNEKDAREAELRRLYTNEPKPEYFQQFGTSHR